MSRKIDVLWLSLTLVQVCLNMFHLLVLQSLSFRSKSKVKILTDSWLSANSLGYKFENSPREQLHILETELIKCPFVMDIHFT